MLSATYTIKRLFWAAIPTRLGPGLRRTYEKITYFGFRFKCPVCSSNLAQFLPLSNRIFLPGKQVIGDGYRPNWLCPICGSTDRERLVYLYLRRRTHLFTRPTRLLHVAPERSLASVFLRQRHLEYVTCDLDRTSISLRADITAMPFAGDSIDVIVCNHVLEHVLDDQKAIAEMYRVLKPGGWALVTVPISMALEETYQDSAIVSAPEREAAFGQSDHVRIYAKDFKNRLQGAGGIVNAFEWSAQTADFGGGNNRFGLIENDIVYIAAKPVQGLGQ